MIALLDRLDYVRNLGVDAERTRRIHPARLGRLLSEAAIMTVQHIADLEPARRTAILVARTTELVTRIADATLAMFEKYIGSLFSKAQNRDERRFQATKRDVAKALLLFRRTIAALKQAQETGEDGVAVVDREVGMRRLDEALPIIGAAAEVADQDILITAAERYSVLRRFSPRFLTAFQFQSNVPHDPVLAAIEMLKALDRTGARNLPKRIPMSFLSPKWRKLIFATGTADRRLYETAVLTTLRERLRGSNIWVAGSRDYRAFENYLLPAEAAGNVGIDQETDATRYMNDRAAALHDRLNFVMARAARGDLDGVEIEDGTLYIARAKPAVPDAARDLAIRLNACQGCVSPRFSAMSMAGPGMPIGSPICVLAIWRRTNRRCWPQSWRTAAILVLPAWPTHRTVSATTIWSTWRNGTSATTTMSPLAPPSSTPIIDIRWRRSGMMGRPPHRTASTSGVAVTLGRVARSMPSTASIQVSWSTRTFPGNTTRSTRGSSRRQ